MSLAAEGRSREVGLWGSLGIGSRCARGQLGLVSVGQLELMDNYTLCRKFSLDKNTPPQFEKIVILLSQKDDFSRILSLQSDSLKCYPKLRGVHQNTIFGLFV